MTEHLYGSFGGLTLPTTAATVDATELALTVLDPSRAALMALFRAALKAEWDSVWAQTCAALPTDHPLHDSTSLIADTLEIDPTEDVMLERRTAWPLLALHRSGDGEFSQTTLHKSQLTQKWNLHLILGPRSGIAEERKLYDVFVAAAKTINECCERRGHPNYQGGALQFFGPTRSGQHPLGSCRVVSYSVGNGTFADKTALYPAMLMVLETTETSADTLGAFPTVEALHMHVAGGSETEGLIPELVEGDTDYPGTMYADG